MCLPQYASFTSPELVFWREKSGRVSEIQKWIYMLKWGERVYICFLFFPNCSAAADRSPRAASLSRAAFHRRALSLVKRSSLFCVPVAPAACLCANYRSAICYFALIMSLTQGNLLAQWRKLLLNNAHLVYSKSIQSVSGGQLKQAITKYYVEPSSLLFKRFMINSGSYQNIFILEICNFIKVLEICI